MQFRSLDFQFNNVSSKSKKLKLVNVDGKNEESFFGVEQEVIEEDNGTDVPLFLGVKRKCQTIPVTFMKVDDLNNPLPYRKGEFDELCKWLIHKEYKPFVSWDNPGIVYYVIFTKAKDFVNRAKEGYISLDMRLSAPYGYSNQLISPYYITKEKIINVYNGSDLDNLIYPDIEFELLGDCRDVVIQNLTLNQTMEFHDLEKNDVIRVYNDGIKDVISKKDKNRNIYKNFNRKFLALTYGKNRIKIIGNCKINIINQYPIALK